MSPQMALAPQPREQAIPLDVNRICKAASRQRPVLLRVWPAEMRRALAAISHLYGLYAVDHRLDTFETELDGFASEMFPQSAISRQIGLALGTSNARRQQRVHDALVAAVASELAREGRSAGYLQGFGVIEKGTQPGQFRLHFFQIPSPFVR